MAGAGASAASTSRATTKEPEFSPQSIRILKKGKRGHELVLTVSAPQDTRFAIGQDYTDAACTAVAVKPGTPSTYQVVCPPAPKGSQLVATISYGDWEYSFKKAL
jgi:hypothetical protein